MIPAGLRVAIVPFPALGDLTIYLRLAQAFREAGADVSYYSDQLAPAAALFDWLRVVAFARADARTLLTDFDLVIWDAGVPPASAAQADGHVLAGLVDAHANLAVVTSKDLPAQLQSRTMRLVVAGREFGPRCASFCRDAKAGLTMVDWVDRYAEENFVLSAPASPPALSTGRGVEAGGRKVVIFPTTPNPKKNYWPCGFRKIARALAASGWDVSFVVVPAELPRLASEFRPFAVIAFPDLERLVAYLRDACLVISNDSGGGHLASMMGLHTVTITRKPADFVWRPGFDRAKNLVVSPLITFKAAGGHIWRPFLPFWRITAYAKAVCRNGSPAAVGGAAGSGAPLV